MDSKISKKCKKSSVLSVFHLEFALHPYSLVAGVTDSLIKARIVPLVRPRGKMQYSPWRGEDRDSEGIIQALYVFSVIRAFIVALPKAKTDEAAIYAFERTNHIESQIRQARDFRGCDELTPEGRALVNRMLDMFE